MKIVIIGGHHISALVLAKLLLQRNHQVVWFGTRYPRWPEKTVGTEYRQVKRAGFPFWDLKAGKFHGNFIRWLLIPFGFMQTLYYLFKLRPQIVFSFGGYLAVPTILSARILGIASFTHEQTRTAGLANRFLKNFVDKVFITWPKSERFFPSKKTILVGLPLRKEIKTAKKSKLFNNDLPTIMFAGGKQGSHSINMALDEILEKLLLKCNVIHQVGGILRGEDQRHFLEVKKKLKPELKKRYQIAKFFEDQQWAEKVASATLVVSRSGAHTVYELAYLAKSAIFIPLPFTFAKEQEENAKLFTDSKAGLVISQSELKPEVLYKKINLMMKEIDFFNKNAQKLKKLVKKDAAESIVNFLEKNFK